MAGRTFSFEVSRASVAAPETLFRLETDGARWSEWARPLIAQSSWARLATPPGGVGAIRRVGTWPVFALEETLEYEQDRRHVYTLVGSAPVEDYRGEVLFTPTERGTDLTWRGTFTEKLPGTGVLVQRALNGVIQLLSARLVRAAERG